MHEEISVSSECKKREHFLSRLANYYCLERQTMALELSLGESHLQNFRYRCMSINETDLHFRGHAKTVLSCHLAKTEFLMP